MRPNRIRELRKAKKLTIVELAEKAGISHPYLVRIEGGKRGLSLPVAERLASAMGVQVVELLGYSKGETLATPPRRDDVEPFEQASDEFAPAVSRKSQIVRYKVKTNSLDRLGLKPGAIVFVDLSISAIDEIRPHDIVLAQIFVAGSPGGENTVLREFIAPSLLITNSSEANEIPFDLDKGHALVKGVVRGNYSPLRT